MCYRGIKVGSNGVEPFKKPPSGTACIEQLFRAQELSCFTLVADGFLLSERPDSDRFVADRLSLTTYLIPLQGIIRNGVAKWNRTAISRATICRSAIEL